MTVSPPSAEAARAARTARTVQGAQTAAPAESSEPAESGAAAGRTDVVDLYLKHIGSGRAVMGRVMG
ncbi:aspartate aminotransferase family protein, partial [Streptomyces coelicoflavus]